MLSTTDYIESALTVLPDPLKQSPLHLDVHVTNKCNLACTHCHSASGHSLPQELSTTELKRLLVDAHAIGVRSLAIAGGEPFYRKDLVDLLELACSLSGWNVAVITNGTLLTPSIAREIHDRCPTINISLSVDGHDATSVSRIRRFSSATPDGGTVYDSLQKTAENCVAAGLRWTVNYCLTLESLDYVEKAYEQFVDSWGAGGLLAIRFFPGGFGLKKRNQLDIPFERWSNWLIATTRAKASGGLEKLRISPVSPWEFYLPLKKAEFDIALAESLWGFRSAAIAFERLGLPGSDTAGRTELAVDADGLVYPSALFLRTPLWCVGNLREVSISEIWSKSAVLGRFREAIHKKHPAVCATCNVWDKCGGGSAARTYILTKQVEEADVACPIVVSSLPKLGF